MKTFTVTYTVGSRTRSITLEAPKEASAVRKVERIAATANELITIVKVEDVTGPSELKALLRF
jgi:hypothetical protein